MSKIIVKNSEVIEFGRGSIGVFNTSLVPTNTEQQPIEAIALDFYTKSFPIRSIPGKEHEIFRDLEAPSVILAFHNLESALVLKEALDKVIERLSNEA